MIDVDNKEDFDSPAFRKADVAIEFTRPDAAADNVLRAFAAGVPVVSVWGATHPYAGFLGFGQDTANAVQLDMICRPCSVFGNKPCLRGDYHCLRGIQPRLIADRVERLL